MPAKPLVETTISTPASSFAALARLSLRKVLCLAKLCELNLEFRLSEARQRLLGVQVQILLLRGCVVRGLIKPCVKLVVFAVGLGGLAIRNISKAEVLGFVKLKVKSHFSSFSRIF